MQDIQKSGKCYVRRFSAPLVVFAFMQTTSNVTIAAPPIAPVLDWARQIGTSDFDQGTGIGADALGNVFVVGITNGNFAGPSVGRYDAFISKYNAAGTLVWSRKFGSTGNDANNEAAVDGLGNAYVSGYTEGSLGGANAGGLDVFVAKYDTSGNRVWIRQLGTPSSENGLGVSSDKFGSIYVTGYTEGNLAAVNAGSADAFLAKFDDLGNLVWSRQMGSSGQEMSEGVSADLVGNVYITGFTTGSLGHTNFGSKDAFVSKFNALGTLLWTRQIGTTGEDDSTGVSVDGLGNVYISGLTTGVLDGSSAGNADAFVSKFDDAGNLLWTRQFGSNDIDISQGVSADQFGNVYLAGEIYGTVNGVSGTSNNAFVSKFDASGNNAWLYQFGTNKYDQCLGVSADGLGDVYVAGETKGGIASMYLGGDGDAFAAKFTEVPEPSVAYATLVVTATLYMRQKRFPERKRNSRLLAWN